MLLIKIKNLYLVIFFLSLVAGCKENTETPPFVFDCKVRFVDQDGNSLLQKNPGKIKEFAVKMLEPSSCKVSVDYDAASDFLYIQTTEWEGSIKNNGNRLQEYIIEVQSPDLFSKQGKDTIRIKYQFKNYSPSVIEAFYNDVKPENIETSVSVFIIKRE